MRSIWVTTFLMLFLSLGARTADAYVTSYNVIGRTCVPTSQTIAGQLLNEGFGGPVEAFWKASKSGTLTLYCAIPTDIAVSNIEFRFRNNTACSGCGGDAITATYLKMHKTTGAVTAIKILGTFTGTNDGTYQKVSSTLSDVHDIGNYVYFVKIDMVRANDSNIQRMYYLSLW